MELKECLKHILEDAERTLDKATGETPESRAAAKVKFQNFIKSLAGGKDEVVEKDEKK